MTEFNAGRATRFATAGAAAMAAVALAASHASAYGISVQSTSSAGGIYSGGSAICTYASASGGGCDIHDYGGGTASAGITPLSGATYVSTSEDVSGAGASASSAITVDLSTATIDLYGADSTVRNSCSTPDACGGTSNGASYNDVLYFVVAGAGPMTVTTIGLTFMLDGSLTNQGTALDDNARSAIDGELNFGGSDARFDLYSDSTSGYQTKAGYLDTLPSDSPGVWTSNADLTSNVFTETYTLTGAAVDIPVQLGVLMNCNDGYACDFSHTAKLALSLPSTVTYTSDSGVFLNPTTGVPEPATWAMMLLGVGMIGGRWRLSRRDGMRSVYG